MLLVCVVHTTICTGKQAHHPHQNQHNHPRRSPNYKKPPLKPSNKDTCLSLRFLNSETTQSLWFGIAHVNQPIFTLWSLSVPDMEITSQHLELIILRTRNLQDLEAPKCSENHGDFTNLGLQVAGGVTLH